MNTELYPYQREALSHLQQRLQDGWRRLYIELPTGTGKSTIAADFAGQRLSSQDFAPNPCLFTLT